MTRVRYYNGITELLTSELSMARKFLHDAGLSLDNDIWVGDGKVGTLSQDGEIWKASFWYYEEEVRRWM